MKAYGWILLLTAFAASPASVDAQEYIYWTDKNDKKIVRNDLSGSPNEDVVTSGLNVPRGIDVHAGIDKVYWTDETDKVVERANPDGSDVETLLTEANNLGDLVVDETNGKVYWITLGTKTVRRADLDGSNVETILSGIIDPTSIALDEVNAKLYWVDSDAKSILRSNLDGSSVETVISTGLNAASGIVIHPGIGKVIWTDESLKIVRRADLDGSNAETIVTEANTLKSMAIDIPSNKIYWVDITAKRIRRSDTDGQNVETVISGLSDPTDIALLSSTALPVELASFDAVLSGSDAVLSWTTLSESDNAGFEVQKRYGDGDFQLAGFVAGAGGSSDALHYSYTISDLYPGQYAFRLKQIDVSGGFAYSPTVEVTVQTPSSFYLLRNYPNPFNPSTTIAYTLPQTAEVSLAVFDLLGRQVRVLASGPQQAGSYEVPFDGAGLPSGVYVYRLQAIGTVETRPMVLLK